MAQTASFGEAAHVAFDSLRSSKLRSFLTLLGIILATTTLIAVMSLIHGMDVYIAQAVSDMGASGFRIVRMAFIGNFDPKKFIEMQKKNPKLTPEEYAWVKDHLTLVQEFGLSAEHDSVEVSFENHNEKFELDGGTANMAVLDNTQVASGRFYSDIEDEHHVAVAVIGNDVKDRLFGESDPVGKTIEVDKRPFTVVGVAKAKGSVFGQSRDSFVQIPIQTYFRTYGTRQGMDYAAMAQSHAVLEEAQDEVRVLLRTYRHLRPNQDDTFSVVASDAIMAAWQSLTGAISATAVGVVSVFMLVGGVVIMNIMLAVVTERTREIGIRKSLGARRQDILNQFLVESSVLAGTGGLAGFLLAWIAAVLVRNLTPVPMAVPASAVFIGVGLSSLIGLFFGIYPARRASRLDPIEALRAEA